MFLKREEIIRKFCQLSKDVMVKRFHARIPADCFCDIDNTFDSQSDKIVFDSKVFEFIEDAVNEKIIRECT